MAQSFHQPEHSGTPAGSSIELAPGVVVDGDVIRWAFARSSGPGGQNVNKLSSKAELRITLRDLPMPQAAIARLCAALPRAIIAADLPEADDPPSPVSLSSAGQPAAAPRAAPAFNPSAELQLVSQSERTQSGNKAECLARLRQIIVAAMAKPKTRRATKPSYGSKQRRLSEKKRDGSIKKTRRSGGHDD